MRHEMKTPLLGIAALVCLILPASRATAQSTLTGVIDIHAHTDPDSRPRSIDALDLAKMAKARGMRGLVLKNHFEPTAAQDYLVRKDVPGLEVFGGIEPDRPAPPSARSDSSTRARAC